MVIGHHHTLHPPTHPTRSSTHLPIPLFLHTTSLTILPTPFHPLIPYLHPLLFSLHSPILPFTPPPCLISLPITAIGYKRPSFPTNPSPLPSLPFPFFLFPSLSFSSLPFPFHIEAQLMPGKGMYPHFTNTCPPRP